MTTEVSPLMLALYQGRSADAAALLAALPAEELTVHEAAAMGVVDRVAALPDQVNAWSPDGFQPLQLACFFGRRSVVEWLLAHGAELDTAARHPFGVTALHAALAGPDPALGRLLVAAGADVNVKQSGDNTPLHTTAHIGSVELTELLLAHDAKSVANKDGKTPRDIAVEHGHTAVAEILS